MALPLDLSIKRLGRNRILGRRHLRRVRHSTLAGLLEAFTLQLLPVKILLDLPVKLLRILRLSLLIQCSFFILALLLRLRLFSTGGLTEMQRGLTRSSSSARRFISVAREPEVSIGGVICASIHSLAKHMIYNRESANNVRSLQRSATQTSKTICSPFLVCAFS